MRSLYSQRLQAKYDPAIRELKRDVVSRIQKARADGVPASRIADAGGRDISIGVVYDMLNAELFSEESWRAMDSALKTIGY